VEWVAVRYAWLNRFSFVGDFHPVGVDAVLAEDVRLPVRQANKVDSIVTPQGFTIVAFPQGSVRFDRMVAW
jgi:hypothetical protein